MSFEATCSWQPPSHEPGTLKEAILGHSTNPNLMQILQAAPVVDGSAKRVKRRIKRNENDRNQTEKENSVQRQSTLPPKKTKSQSG
jgi:hypothetical protein